jgi:anti-sigma factor RsiW
MNSQEPQIDPEVTEELVAYLDGELDEDAVERVEEMLSESPQARDKVDELMRAWDCLEFLPHVRATDEFTDRTLSTIRVAEAANEPEPTSRVNKEQVRRWSIRGGWALVVLGICLCAYLATNRWIPDESQELVEDLPLIENLHLYSDVESVEFLEELEASGLFEEDASDDAETE